MKSSSLIGKSIKLSSIALLCSIYLGAIGTAHSDDYDEPLPIERITREPQEFIGREVDGVARVTRVVSDRGFFVGEKDGRQLLVVLTRERKSPQKIQVGQLLDIEGIVAQADEQGRLSNAPNLEAETRQALQQEKTVLVALPKDVEIEGR